MKSIRTTLALLLTLGLVGCGSATTGLAGSYVGTASSDTANISSAQAVELDSFNSSGDLDELDDDSLMELDSTAVVDGSLATQGLFTKGSTRIGFIRSTEDGKFFLQTKQGFWKKTDVSYALSPKNEAISLKLAKDLNCKVLVRGATAGTTMTIQSAFKVPDVSVLVDLLRCGSIGGKVYSASTLVGIANTNVTLRSLTTNNIYRATTKKDGTFKAHRLPVGDYTMQASVAGFQPGVLSKLTVARWKTTAGNLPLTSAI